MQEEFEEFTLELEKKKKTNLLKKVLNATRKDIITVNFNPTKCSEIGKLDFLNQNEIVGSFA